MKGLKKIIGCCGLKESTEIAPETDSLRGAIRAGYGALAKGEGAGCGCAGADLKSLTELMGYSKDELTTLPEGADMGLGCGNPVAIASLRPGQTVLDLGSGGGIDCFLAARKVGPSGQVIGVDMTPEMVLRAREAARKNGFTNVEFRLGEIEHLPVADSSVDVIISNCVINLSPDKRQVFREAYRVLRPGGKLCVSDIVALKEPPEQMKKDLVLLTGCVSGALRMDELKSIIKGAGFTGVRITINERSRDFISQWFPGREVEEYIASAYIEATKS
jgi:SAM-dependent methyltransferase